MLRIDILLSKDDKVPMVIVDALQAELEKQIQPLFAESIIRVRVGSSKNIEITGCAKDDKENILNIIETIFTSDDWLPE